MYPQTGAFQFKPELLSFELLLSHAMHVRPFAVLGPATIVTLRLSGNCHLFESGSARQAMPALRHLTLVAVTSTYFDRKSLAVCFAGARLDSFAYAQGHKLGFEIRDSHLETLVSPRGPGAHLRTLVLLQCIYLSSHAIAACLQSLPALEYLALSLVTVNELRCNFADAFPPSLRVLKLQVTNSLYSRPFIKEEAEICDTIEHRFLRCNHPLSILFIHVHDEVMSVDGRAERWKSIASTAHIDFRLGLWEEDECGWI